MRRVYFDYAATTPVDKRVLEVMKPYWSSKFGNPSSLHLLGQDASAAVFEARQKIAQSIGADYREVFFTGSATESNNLALRGAVKAWQKKHPEQRARAIISAFEHECIVETAKALERYGVEVIRIPVSRAGFIDLKKLKMGLNENTVLVSVMYVNNEVGTIQPINEIAKVITNYKSKIANSAQNRYPLFHTDAAQAFQYLDCNVDTLGVDMMTLSSHKMCGPKGIGALYIRKSKEEKMRAVRGSEIVRPVMFGGGQEEGVRSGTENVPAIVGFAKAVGLASALRAKEIKRVGVLRDALLKGVRRIFPRLEINGSMSERAPNNVNIYIPKILGEQMLVQLDLLGVSASSGAACSARSLEASMTLRAMGYDELRSKNSIRFTLGRFTTADEIQLALKAIAKVEKSILG